MKKTLIIGASENPARYSYLAAEALKIHNHEIIALGLKEGSVNGIPIVTGRPKIENLDTVTMYISAKNQPEFYDYIISLKPKRVLFNPGTENPEFVELLKKNGIESTQACTLVLLSIGSY